MNYPEIYDKGIVDDILLKMIQFLPNKRVTFRNALIAFEDCLEGRNTLTIEKNRSSSRGFHEKQDEI